MLREAAQALVVMAATLALGGLGTWLAPEPAAADYPMACMSESEQDEQGRVRLWLVDGFNVLHVGVLQGRDRRGWWKRERREELLERVKGFRAEHDGADVLVVFDGKHPPEPAHEADVPVVFAPSAVAGSRIASDDGAPASSPRARSSHAVGCPRPPQQRAGPKRESGACKRRRRAQRGGER
jgi:hypothetical protein